jgi:hypothetical protein
VPGTGLTLSCRLRNDPRGQIGVEAELRQQSHTAGHRPNVIEPQARILVTGQQLLDRNAFVGTELAVQIGAQ